MGIDRHVTNSPRLFATIATVALLALAGSAHAGFNEGDPEFEPPEPQVILKLKVQERKQRFDKQNLSVNDCPVSCVVQIMVTVPKTAKHRHGVGLDGGPYQNVDGAGVAPGRKTSLTITLEPGKYVVYDSYKKNRKKPGYRVRLTVK